MCYVGTLLSYVILCILLMWFYGRLQSKQILRCSTNLPKERVGAKKKKDIYGLWIKLIAIEVK